MCLPIYIVSIIFVNNVYRTITNYCVQERMKMYFINFITTINYRIAETGCHILVVNTSNTKWSFKPDYPEKEIEIKKLLFFLFSSFFHEEPSPVRFYMLFENTLYIHHLFSYTISYRSTHLTYYMLIKIHSLAANVLSLWIKLMRNRRPSLLSKIDEKFNMKPKTAMRELTYGESWNHGVSGDRVSCGRFRCQFR